MNNHWTIPCQGNHSDQVMAYDERPEAYYLTSRWGGEPKYLCFKCIYNKRGIVYLAKTLQSNSKWRSILVGFNMRNDHDLAKPAGQTLNSLPHRFLTPIL